MKKKKKRCAKKGIHTNPVPAEELEREVLDIILNFGIVELATNKTFRIEDTRIHMRT